VPHSLQSHGFRWKSGREIAGEKPVLIAKCPKLGLPAPSRPRDAFLALRASADMWLRRILSFREMNSPTGFSFPAQSTVHH
jgi:hypothetical protein